MRKEGFVKRSLSESIKRARERDRVIRYSSNPFPEHTYRLHGRLDENTGGEFQFLYRKDFENSWSQACCRTGRHVSNGMQYLSFLSRSSLLSFLSLPSSTLSFTQILTNMLRWKWK